ncbi:MAG TPA: hypothetical protein VLE22_03375 [Bryobacteraceae bacterium]|nr:hypothetical protein [Bryobacteraceae bacterium]
MKTVKIDDLETRKDLDAATMKTISGGNLIGQGGQFTPVTAIGGGIFSPQVVTNVPVNVPIAIQLDLDTNLGIDTKVANVIASAASGITQ